MELRLFFLSIALSLFGQISSTSERECDRDADCNPKICIDGSCFDRRAHGLFCSHDRQCQSSDPKMTCLNSKCECIEGYKLLRESCRPQDACFTQIHCDEGFDCINGRCILSTKTPLADKRQSSQLLLIVIPITACIVIIGTVISVILWKRWRKSRSHTIRSSMIHWRPPSIRRAGREQFELPKVNLPPKRV